MVIVEVTKTYNDKNLNARKAKGDLFKTDRIRAQELVSAGVAKVIFEEQVPDKGGTVQQDDNSLYP